MSAFPLPSQKSKRIIFRIPSENLVELHKIKLTKYSSSSGFLNSQTCIHWALAIHQLQFRFSYPSASSHGSFCRGGFCSEKLWSLYLPVSTSHFGGSSLPSEFTSLADLRIVYFFVCSAFYLWEQSDNFWGFMLDQKTSPRVFFSLKLAHTEPPAIYQLHFLFSCLDVGSHRFSSSWSSPLISCDSLYLPFWLSNFRGNFFSVTSIL